MTKARSLCGEHARASVPSLHRAKAREEKDVWRSLCERGLLSNGQLGHEQAGGGAGADAPRRAAASAHAQRVARRGEQREERQREGEGGPH